MNCDRMNYEIFCNIFYKIKNIIIIKSTLINFLKIKLI